MKDLTAKIVELYGEVTPTGRKLLDEVIGSIVFHLDTVRETMLRDDDDMCACGGKPKLEHCDVCEDCL